MELIPDSYNLFLMYKGVLILLLKIFYNHIIIRSAIVEIFNIDFFINI